MVAFLSQGAKLAVGLGSLLYERIRLFLIDISRREYMQIASRILSHSDVVYCL